MRQALFDSLLHAPWARPGAIVDARVLDAFAGTGALGLEALSRGAAHATFFEPERAALAALRRNIAACGAGDACTVLAADATAPPTAPAACGLVFIDPPYRQGFPARALAALLAAGWIAAGALLVIEAARDEAMPDAGEVLLDRAHGAARLTVLRAVALTVAPPPQ